MGGPRPAAHGFQLAFRTGLLLPFGDATGAPGDSLSRRYAWQIPLIVDLGARFARSLFLGVSLGLGYGATGSDARVDAACTDDDDNLKNDIACNVLTLRAGLEVLYSFAPDARLNPWIGYGIGFESSQASISDDYTGLEETDTSHGITYALLSAGFDLRNPVGVGPLVEAALGEFTHSTTDLGARGKFRYDIPDRALHAWVLLGLRIVVNP